MQNFFQMFKMWKKKKRAKGAKSWKHEVYGKFQNVPGETG